MSTVSHGTKFSTAELTAPTIHGPDQMLFEKTRVIPDVEKAG